MRPNTDLIAVKVNYSGRTRPVGNSGFMFLQLRGLVLVLAASLCIVSLVTIAAAQAPEQKPPEPSKQAQPDPKDAQAAKELAAKKVDEFADAARQLSGPAGQAECVWLGRRAVNLLWRDDLDTAFRHLDLYDRFGCPSGHVQTTFRCVVRQGNIDPKAPESLATRVHACWVNPGFQASGNAPSSAAGAVPGTNAQ